MMTGVACGSCGTDLRANAKFCDECGAPTSVSADAATYKQVTVLFADVVRSTAIAAEVDIERFRDIMTELLERVSVVIRRYGGTVEYNGDGVMALFGAPVALEDHAFRGCLAGLAIQHEATMLAAEVKRRDGVALQLRVGLNSGRVIAGEIGSGSLGYAATGETVGFAQRMESAATPGGVMLSESTARLVEHTATVAEPDWVRVKGSDEPVPAYRLVATGPREALVGHAEGSLVGRRWEMAALDAIVDRAIVGRGEVVNVAGPPGIGKSRVARETAAMAAARGVEVFWTFCESHASDIPFHAVTRLLRAGSGVADLDGAAARAQLRTVVPADVDPQDLQLLADLLGIADPELPVPQIDPDARRRRLTALINSTSLVRTEPALFIIEDTHWIDAVSESMLADFLTVVPRTPTMVLITARPEYEGALTRVRGAQAIALAPLSDSDTEALLNDLLGTDPSVIELATIIADRAAGNAFFAEEMVRELVQRGVLCGERGRYVCRTDVADVNVPATVQAAIEARIDRLTTPAKHTLNAASVIGGRFEEELLVMLNIDPVFGELLDAELIDQVRFTPSAEYAFRHPLIRAVAYESQLKSDRAEWHRRLAGAIQEREPESVEENAALIAEHMEAAGEQHVAYGWHMRAAASSAKRDFRAARLSWERALRIADALPADDPGLLAMRIAPRTMLCATIWQGRGVERGESRFEELRELCAATGDKVSLAIGMTGLATQLIYSGRVHEGSRLVSEQMELLESIGDPDTTMGLAFVAFVSWFASGEVGKVLRSTQTVIGLADGNPTKGGGFGMGSPLAVALAWRGVARWWLGLAGWRQDHDDAVPMARLSDDPATLAGVIAWTYGLEIQYGVFQADDSALGVIEETVQAAAGSSNDPIFSLAEYTLGVALLNRDGEADRQRGLELMVRARDVWRREGVAFLVPVADLWIARHMAGRGERDAAIAVMREAVDDIYQTETGAYAVWASCVFVETLLDGGEEAALTEAEDAIDRLAHLPTEQTPAVIDITLLRLRALMARARGDDVDFKDLASRYHAMAKSLDYEGHIAWAEAMIE
ncbi:MAG TPA: adenylate/guanylate cyclase domain-containing protein [Mycobacterium sp.]|nr:adenylate/guanylate cyclase domain-containing protein [Mycobacterium sp.]